METKKIFSIKSLLIALGFVALVTATYYLGYNKGYSSGYADGDTQIFHRNDGGLVVFSKDSLLAYKTRLMGAYADALQWYYLGNKEEWYNVFMNTREYKNLDSLLVDGWEDFYDDDFEVLDYAK